MKTPCFQGATLAHPIFLQKARLPHVSFGGGQGHKKGWLGPLRQASGARPRGAATGLCVLLHPHPMLMLVAGLVGAKNLSTSTCCTLCPHRQPTRGTRIPHSAEAGAGAPEAGRLTLCLQQAVRVRAPSLHSSGLSPGQRGQCCLEGVLGPQLACTKHVLSTGCVFSAGPEELGKSPLPSQQEKGEQAR